MKEDKPMVADAKSTLFWFGKTGPAEGAPAVDPAAQMTTLGWISPLTSPIRPAAVATVRTPRPSVVVENMPTLPPGPVPLAVEVLPAAEVSPAPEADALPVLPQPTPSDEQAEPPPGLPRSRAILAAGAALLALAALGAGAGLHALLQPSARADATAPAVRPAVARRPAILSARPAAASVVTGADVQDKARSDRKLAAIEHEVKAIAAQLARRARSSRPRVVAASAPQAAPKIDRSSSTPVERRPVPQAIDPE